MNRVPVKVPKDADTSDLRASDSDLKVLSNDFVAIIEVLQDQEQEPHVLCKAGTRPLAF